MENTGHEPGFGPGMRHGFGGRHHGHGGRGHRFGGGEGGFPFGGPSGRGAFGGGPFGGRAHGGGGGGRARRGEARYIFLEALKDGPRHGYEIIKALEERSSGRYVPSAGTIYPTLQHLEDLGLVQAAPGTGDGRRVYELTDAGRAELDANTAHVAAFWERFAGPPLSAAVQHEVGFLRDEWDDLARTIWGRLAAGSSDKADDAARVRALRRALERCKNEVREIIVGDGQETV